MGILKQRIRPVYISPGPTILCPPLLLWIFLCLVPGALMAQNASPLPEQPALKLNGENKKFVAGSELEYLEDPNADLTLEEIKSPAYRNKFLSNRKGRRVPGYTKSVYWIRLPLQNDSGGKNFILEMESAHLGDVTLYSPDSSEEYRMARIGELRGFTEQEIDYPGIIFQLKIPPGKQKVYYLRINAVTTLQLNLYVYNRSAYIKIAGRQLVFYGIYYGIFTVLIVYNLFLFLILRDRSYLLYLFYILSYGAYQFSANRLASQYFWPTQGGWTYTVLPMAAISAAIGAMLFFRECLLTYKYAPAVDRVIKFVSACFIPVLFVFPWLPYEVAFILSQYCALLTVLVLYVATVRTYRRGYKPARLILIAWNAFMIGIILYVLKNFGVLSGNFLTIRGIQIGSAIEMLLLSLALADRMDRLRKERERARQRAMRSHRRSIGNLRRADRLKNEFLATTSHELRTPLNGIIGIAESLMAGAGGKISAAQLNDLSMIASSGQRLSNLVDDILDFSKLKYHRLRIHPRPVDVRQVTEIVLRICGPLTVKKNLELRNEVPEGLPMVYADENRLEQIMFNLVGNAIKFTPGGTIRVTGERRGDLIEISVIDTGPGVPPHKRELIFKLFEQADSAPTREVGGSGLGLSLTRRLVELHGGELNLDPDGGDSYRNRKGARFNFTLLLVPEDYRPSSTERELEDMDADQPEMLKRYGNISYAALNEYESARSPVPVENASDIRVLAVDDDPLNLRVVENHLALKKYQVITAEDGQTALDLLDSNEKFDMVLLDIMMPRLSGYDVCRRIRERYTTRELPVLLLTAKSGPRDIVEGFKIGANDYLMKPFSRDELLARVEFHIRFQRANRELTEIKRDLEETVIRRTRVLHKALTRLKERDDTIRAELKIAHHIQSNLLPAPMTVINDYRIAGYYRPLEKLSGDFYDILPLSGDKFAYLMADASGHGIPAALLTTMAKIAFSEASRGGGDAGKILGEARRLVLKGVNSPEYYITASLAVFGKKRMTFASAGHLHPYLIRGDDGSLETLDERGFFMGMALDEDYDYDVGEKELRTGDRLCFFTDGLVEALSIQDKQYGDQGLIAILLETRDLPIEEARKRIVEDWEAYTAGVKIEDDVTFSLIDVL